MSGCALLRSILHCTASGSASKLVLSSTSTTTLFKDPVHPTSEEQALFNCRPCGTLLSLLGSYQGCSVAQGLACNQFGPTDKGPCWALLRGLAGTLSPRLQAFFRAASMSTGPTLWPEGKPLAGGGISKPSGLEGS